MYVRALIIFFKKQTRRGEFTARYIRRIGVKSAACLRYVPNGGGRGIFGVGTHSPLPIARVSLYG